MLGRCLVEATFEADAEILGVRESGSVCYFGNGKVGILEELGGAAQAYVEYELFDRHPGHVLYLLVQDRAANAHIGYELIYIIIRIVHILLYIRHGAREKFRIGVGHFLLAGVDYVLLAIMAAVFVFRTDKHIHLAEEVRHVERFLHKQVCSGIKG